MWSTWCLIAPQLLEEFGHTVCMYTFGNCLDMIQISPTTLPPLHHHSLLLPPPHLHQKRRRHDIVALQNHTTS